MVVRVRLTVALSAAPLSVTAWIWKRTSLSVCAGQQLDDVELCVCSVCVSRLIALCEGHGLQD